MPAPAHSLQCLEVWGGNQAIDNGVVMPGLDARVFSRPYQGQRAGGDVHYLSSCATGRIVRIAVADVSGHGDGVAELALTLRQLMRRYVNYIDQSRILQSLNQEFGKLAEAGNFATAVVATYWTPTDELVLCNAGHPPPLWYRASKRAWEAMDLRAGGGSDLANIPLGIAEPTTYDQVGLRLGRGDLVIIYSDCLIEGRGPDGKMLGAAGLLDLARGLDPADATAFVSELVAAVERFGGGTLPADDLTLLALRPNAFKPRISLMGGVGAGWKMTRELASSIVNRRSFGWPQLTPRNLLGAFWGGINRSLRR